MLTLEIELLTGVYRAGLPDGSGAEWPPHPERLFSALAQAWGDGGCDGEERAALEWLERQGAPWIEADNYGEWVERTAPTVFVPPNDDRGNEITVLPERRRRQARVFRAAVPTNAIIRFGWPQALPSKQERAALDVLARRVASLGHSSSLVRIALVEREPGSEQRLWSPSADGGISLRVPHEGRLERLAQWHQDHERPRGGAAARYSVPTNINQPEPTKSVFGAATDWFVFEDAGGFRPDILGFAQVAKRVRDSLMTLGPQPPPEVLSGHTTNGSATARPHLAVVPLANVGWQYATGDLLGFAVVLPRALEPADRRLVLKALAKFAQIDLGGDAHAKLNFGDAGVWKLEQIAMPVRSSLKPARYCSAAVSWASVTPMLLDRFPDHGDTLEEARLIAAACRNIDLPDPIAIQIHKHSPIKGAPSAYPARGERSGPDWSFPKGIKFASRPRRHVVLHFAENIEGPVILGAGRFQGFGLCLPLTGERIHEC
jgi:CRISPR-associated protein Csb2